jgi:hypothetical protein
MGEGGCCYGWGRSWQPGQVIHVKRGFQSAGWVNRNLLTAGGQVAVIMFAAASRWGHGNWAGKNTNNLDVGGSQQQASLDGQTDRCKSTCACVKPIHFTSATELRPL